MYHRLAQSAFDPWGLAVSPRRFEEQLDWLVRRHDVLPLAEFAELHRKGRLPARAIAITFDDGYACNLAVGAPLLAAYETPATIFLAIEPITRGREFWWDELERIMFHSQTDSLTLDVPGISRRIDFADPPAPAPRWSPGGAPQDPRQRAFMDFWGILRTMNPTAQAATMSALRAQAGIGRRPRPSHRPLTREEIRTAATNVLIEFGAHTMNHPALSEHDEPFQQREIDDSRRSCAEVTGRQPSSFAYPFGDYDRRTVQIVRDAGFSAAVTTHSGAVRGRTSEFELPRIHVGDWSAAQLASALGRA
jgi:peptidoglycan/xylan/chitin deacetylase (PgdA/CDA1 family)